LLGPVPALIAYVVLSAASTARAQEIEPRAYSNAPVGVNFLIAAYAYTRGGVAFDPALPVSDPQLETSRSLSDLGRPTAQPWMPAIFSA
jgi:hypothetical protein